VLVSDLARETPAPARRRRLGLRASAAALSAAGLVAAVVLTSAGSSGAATAGTVSLPRGTTLTGTSASAAGRLGIRFNYTTPDGKVNVRLLAFNGQSRVRLKKAVLVFLLAPSPRITKAPGPAGMVSVKQGPHLVIIALRLPPHARSFHGVLSGHELVPFRRAGLVPGETVTMTLANSVSVKSHGVSVIRPVAQVGLQFSPSFR
jgi:hypothetical protein